MITIPYSQDCAPDPAPPEETDPSEFTQENFDHLWKRNMALDGENRRLRAELDAHWESTAWTISPAMAQEQIEQLSTKLEKAKADTALLDRLDAVTAAEFRPGTEHLTGREILERNVAAKEAEQRIDLA